MDIEVNISFGGQSVFVQAGSLNKQFANLMTLENNKIVEMGKTGEEIAQHNPDAWEKVKDKVVFKPIFDPQNFDPETAYWAIRIFASNIHDELRGMKLFDRIICNVNIPKYELFSEKDKEHFETQLERWPKLRSLVVNGITTVSKGWQYKLAEFILYWGRFILLALFIIILSRQPDVLFKVFAPLIQNPPFGFAFVFPIIFLTALWGTEILWLITMQWLLPRQTIQRMFASYQLQFVPANKMSISKLLASWILGKDD